MHPLFEIQKDIEKLAGSSYFVAKFQSIEIAIKNLNKLSFVNIDNQGVTNLPTNIYCGIAPMEDKSAAVILGGMLSVEQRTESFSLLNSVAHDGLIVVPPKENKYIAISKNKPNILMGSSIPELALQYKESKKAASNNSYEQRNSRSNMQNKNTSLVRISVLVITILGGIALFVGILVALILTSLQINNIEIVTLSSLGYLLGYFIGIILCLSPLLLIGVIAFIGGLIYLLKKK